MSKLFLSCVLLAMLALPAAAFSPRVDEGGEGGNIEDDVPTSAVPEPSAGLVFGAGALIVAARLRRQRR